jgi:hypothetical protein
VKLRRKSIRACKPQVRMRGRTRRPSRRGKASADGGKLDSTRGRDKLIA